MKRIEEAIVDGESKDLVLKCVDCGEEFVFSESEQEFFKSKGFDNPKRCKDCRAKKKANRMDRGPQAGRFQADRPSRFNQR